MKIKSVNPYTEEIIHEFDSLTFDDCEKEIEKSRGAFHNWRIIQVPERVQHLKFIAKKLRENNEKYAKTITTEMGKPIKESIAEIEKCAWLCDYYFNNAIEFLQDEQISTEAEKSYVTFEPLGIILGIMPWNFPFWQVFRFAIPAITAGNVCLLKHASNVPSTALEIEKIFNDSGLPPYVFRTLLIDSSTAMKIIEKEKVDGVSLTGSFKAGSEVGSIAGKRIRKLVLELGGSDPFIVLDDANIKDAARTAVQSRLINNGQSCIAAKRFIVMQQVIEEFKTEFIKQLSQLKIGDPMKEETDIGPVAKKQFVQDLYKQLKDAEMKGAKIIWGPKPPQGKSFFFQPVVVTNVDLTCNILNDEVFGPIAPIITVRNENEAIDLANSTKFGLGASIWSSDINKVEKLSKKIEAGFVAINDLVKSDPRLPFGGVKSSGVGRELSSHGLKEFVNVKSVVIKRTQEYEEIKAISE
jgi:succinate-semialdehyde dehydrogenase/glutarate-semialdehyde dehydrogenase